MQAISAPTEALTASKAPTLGFTRAKRVTRSTGHETATDRLNRVLPWTTKAANSFSAGVYSVPARDAKKMREISLDPKGWITSLKFDVDSPDAGMAWIEAGLPAPNFIIKNPANGHAHYVYMLKSWVQIDPSKKATRWLASIERAFTAALGADARYSGTLVHNPLNEDAWNVMVPRDEPFTLAELAQHVDMHVPLRSYTLADSGVGRNVEVFDKTRMWAYGAAAKGSEMSFAEWYHLVAQRADTHNSFPEHPRGNLSDAEIRSIVKSVATWVWEKYAQRPPDPEAIERRRDQERQRQARREASRHRSLRSRTEYTARASERRSWAAKWRAEGVPVRQIAERLNCSGSEVYRLLAEPSSSTIATARVVRATLVRARGDRSAPALQCPPAASGSCDPGGGAEVDLLAYARSLIGKIRAEVPLLGQPNSIGRRPEVRNSTPQGALGQNPRLESTPLRSLFPELVRSSNSHKLRSRTERRKNVDPIALSAPLPRETRQRNQTIAASSPPA